MRKIDRVGDRIAVGGINRNELVAFAHFHLAKHLHIPARTALFSNAGLLDEFHKWQRAAVEDGEFEIVQFHNGVIHAQPGERREQVFGGGNQHALFHQAGGIADTGNVAAVGLDLEVIQIGSSKHNSRSGRGRENLQAYRCAAVQSNATARHGRAESLLLNQTRQLMSR